MADELRVFELQLGSIMTEDTILCLSQSLRYDLDEPVSVRAGL